MAAKISAIGLTLSFGPYLRSAMVSHGQPWYGFPYKGVYRTAAATSVMLITCH